MRPSKHLFTPARFLLVSLSLSLTSLVAIAADSKAREREDLPALLEGETALATKSGMNADFVPGMATILDLVLDRCRARSDAVDESRRHRGCGFRRVRARIGLADICFLLRTEGDPGGVARGLLHGSTDRALQQALHLPVPRPRDRSGQRSPGWNGRRRGSNRRSAAAWPSIRARRSTPSWMWLTAGSIWPRKAGATGFWPRPPVSCRTSRASRPPRRGARRRSDGDAGGFRRVGSSLSPSSTRRTRRWSWSP
ncbi:hypothetical protein Atep_09550 [Allochromatium tepidum]|uniref:Uncharacterized protein n=1 Tax=Allochromatium tepidum TaxID=553982 RepID=A0ABM7QKG8_9GAMM|nr:hypothetical protein Atep_09550 [Allochromatium tepidum]